MDSSFDGLRPSLPCGIVSDPQNQSPLSTTDAGGSPNTSILVDEIQSEQPGWSVLHNPEIKQALHIDLVETINFTARVYCVKFSPDGKYLAAGLDKSGKTYIYDVEKRSNFWLAP